MKCRGMVLTLLLITLLSPFLFAQTNKVEITTTKDVFAAGESINFKISLYDENNNLVTDNLGVVIADSEQRREIKQTVESNKFINLDLGEGAIYGYWVIVANYKGVEAKKTFSVEIEELAEFQLEGDVLTIRNIGNTKYSRTVQILIGETTGIKEPKLDVGKEIEYRLIAPPGEYAIKITDGKTTLTKSNVALTGNAIGILDERVSESNSFLTSGINENDEDSLSWEYLKRNKLSYVFIATIVGVFILIAIERRYRIKRELKIKK